MGCLRWLGGLIILFVIIGLILRILGWILELLIIAAVVVLLLSFLFDRRH